LTPFLHLAPLHGVTNRIFRNIYAAHFSGIDCAMAPFISSIHSENTYAKGRANHFKDILPEQNTSLPLIPQLLSNDASSFIETAKTIADYGYKEVNWNLGCPFPMVTNKKRGSGFLPHTELIKEMLSSICSSIPIKLSIKLRLGYNTNDEIYRLMPILNEYDLSGVILHPRLGVQMYTGSVDLDGFQKAYDLCNHKLVYNGDIKDLSFYKTVSQRFPLIQEYMLGRGLISNPFLPSLIKGEALPENHLEIVKNYHDALYASYAEVLFGPKHLLDKMKEIWTYLALSFSNVEKELKNISRAKTLEDYAVSVKAVFNKGKFV